MTDTDRRYAFDWSLLGDVELGRPNMGVTTRIEVYRLMQYCFRDVIEQRLGTEATDEVFRDAGRLAGRELCAHMLAGNQGFAAFIRELQGTLRELKIGILRVEQADDTQASLVVTIAEDLECSGLPELDYETCTYDEGLLAGLLEGYTGNAYHVREVDCWTTGDRTCRFQANVVEIEEDTP